MIKWIASMALMLALPVASTAAQPSLKEQVVGTWTYVSVDLIRASPY